MTRLNERVVNRFFCTAEEAYEKGGIIDIAENVISIDFDKIKVYNKNQEADPWDSYTYGNVFLDLSNMVNLKEVRIGDIYGLPKYFLILPSMEVKITNKSTVCPCIWEDDSFVVHQDELLGVFPKNTKVSLPKHIKVVDCGRWFNGCTGGFRFIPDGIEIEYNEENLSSIEDKYFKDYYLYHGPFCKKIMA